MTQSVDRLAKKYARAYLNLYGTMLTPSSRSAIQQLCKFLSKNRWIYAYLHLSSINLTKKNSFIDSIAQMLKLDNSSVRLIKTLLKANRIELTGSTMHQILILDQQDHGVVSVTITSSHPLDEAQRHTITNYLQRFSTPEIQSFQTTFIVDAHLIAGLKIKSNHFQWERSIARQLLEIKQKVFEQVHV